MDLDVYLSRWIISDGNYDDFHVGETRQFALEFYAQTPLGGADAAVKLLKPLHAYRYEVSAEIVFATTDVWVIDCGHLAYAEGTDKVVPGVQRGDFIRGEIMFGVDPFFYFERLWRLPGIPPLIHEWCINSIDQETTPLILSEVCGRPGYVRDQGKLSFAPVNGTDQTLTKPPDTCPEYVLHCTRLEGEPQHEFRHSQRPNW